MSTPLDVRENKRIVQERYRLCGQCGNFCGVSENQIYCMICGEKLMEECPRCKEPIVYPTARFCPACGIILVKAQNLK
jgi:predicted amidophosphoribosyltransferase